MDFRFSIKSLYFFWFQRVTGIYSGAKETLALAEEGLKANSSESEFYGVWQEMLNHAKIKV